MKKLTQRLALMATMVLLGAVTQLRASTVQQMTFGEIAQQAELIFAGTVLDHETVQTAPRDIHTRVRFSVEDVLKGQYNQATITLIYPGGRVGNIEMRVGEMQMPQPEETGIYFVGSTTEELIHPLVGWAQGHYLIRPDEDGTPRIHTADARPVVAVDDNAPSPATTAISSGRAAGVRVQALATPTAPLSVGDFKAAIRDVLLDTP